MEVQKMKKKIIALLAVAMLTFATSAMATDAILDLGGSYNTIDSLVKDVNGNVNKTTEGGGSVGSSSLNGRQLDYLYCVDLFTTVYPNTTYPNTTINNSGNINGIQIANADKVAYLLTTYGTGAQKNQQIALQAAIWHEVNNPGVYDLNINSYGSTSDIATLYNTYVAAADSYSGPNLVSNFTWITPGIKNANGLTMYQGLVTNNPVPEPSTIILLGTGMLFMAVYGKRRMNKEAL